MDTAVLTELRRFDPQTPIEEAWTPPSSWYTWPSFADRERETTFQRWLCVARADQLAAPGRYVSGQLAAQPWLVLRGEDGQLRGFHNVCRHHAAALCQGEGSCEAAQLVCPYHGWTYRLDGTLKSAPRMAGVRVACNWKVYVDNYLDGGYHVPVLHGSLSDQLDLESYRTELFETYSIQSCRGGAAAPASNSPDFAERIGDEALYAWIHPNLMLNRYGPWLDTNHVWPLGPDACQVDMDYYVVPELADDEAFLTRSLAASEQVQDEDVTICESVQAGLRSPAYDVGRYAPQVEQGEHHFHCLLAADLAGA